MDMRRWLVIALAVSGLAAFSFGCKPAEEPAKPGPGTEVKPGTEKKAPPAGEEDAPVKKAPASETK